eukprot:5344940-Amphidinium_carterae.1
MAPKNTVLLINAGAFAVTGDVGSITNPSAPYRVTSRAFKFVALDCATSWGCCVASALYGSPVFTAGFPGTALKVRLAAVLVFEQVLVIAAPSSKLAAVTIVVRGCLRRVWLVGVEAEEAVAEGQ